MPMSLQYVLSNVRWRPTADWRCLANGWAATQACVCRLWAVACVASGSGPVTKAH